MPRLLSLGFHVALFWVAIQSAQAAFTEVWTRRYDGPSTAYDTPHAVAVDAQGNVVVTGASGRWDTNAFPIYDWYTAKYAATNGALLWEKRILGAASDDAVGSAVAVDNGGNVIVAGRSPNATNSDYYTAKFAAADGALLWERHYNGPANQYDGATAAVLDNHGNVIVTGSSHNGTNFDAYTAKYAAADGALLWEQRYNGPDDDSDFGRAVAVDAAGNVVVTGSSNNKANVDYYTAKYAAADGALLWLRRYDGPANLDDQPKAVAVDAAGNVVVTGESYRREFRTDYYTAKYAASNGAVLWEKRYSGPANGSTNFSNTATAVTVDSGGNVIVAGYSGVGNYDCYTVKYAAADGALLWEQRYNGPDDHNDFSRAVVVDADGNVVVTGSTGVEVEIGSRQDFYTAKYAAADGALLWEKTYNAPANGDDEASLLALTPYGMVVIAGASDNNFDPQSTSYGCLTLVYAEPLPPVSIALVPEGVRLRFPGIAGLSYRLERAPSVNGPWSTLAIPIAPPGGPIEHIDTMPPAESVFYRMALPVGSPGTELEFAL